MHRPNKRNGFTLIELLVVVTIIVILLALLVPALTSAIYRSELTSCAGQLDSIGTGIILYAHNHKDRYPYRRALNLTAGKDEGSPVWLVFAGPMGVLQYSSGAGREDDRPAYSKYIAIDAFVDPLAETIDLDAEEAKQNNDDVHASYELLWNWGYNGEGLMEKIGSTVTWMHPVSKKLHKWNVLAMDRDSYASSTATASHPDADGKLTEDVKNPESTDDGFEIWASQWAGATSATNLRGKLDRNFLHDDGSVRRINDVVAGLGGTGAQANQPIDKRMALAPLSKSAASYATSYTLMPGTN